MDPQGGVEQTVVQQLFEQEVGVARRAGHQVLGQLEKGLEQVLKYIAQFMLENRVEELLGILVRWNRAFSAKSRSADPPNWPLRTIFSTQNSHLHSLEILVVGSY